MRRLFVLLLALLLTTSVLPAAASPTMPPPPAWHGKVDPWVLDTSAAGETEFLVFLRDQAALSETALLRSKAQKGAYVYRVLSQHAERTQAPLRAVLQRLGVEWRPYWVANMIWVRGNATTVQALAERADVAHLYANPRVKQDLPAIESSNAAVIDAANAIEWNILKVNADDVWAAGVTGAGAVIGGQDTGYDWTHPALKGKYRGWNGVTANHNYNWHDAIHSGGGSCGPNSQQPCDDSTHGTHTMGTMVGDDGAGNQVGMAPGARWIGCRNMDQGWGTPATYTECYQWFIAPTDLAGSNADPHMAPDVINNSWGCPPSEGCTDPNVLLTVVNNVRAAGIVTVHSAGNSGSTCSTVNTPAAIYNESFTVGSTQSNDTIASSSSRGPALTSDGSYRLKPNVAAPGVSVRSSLPGGGYGSMSGTSMAGPHVAGAVALLIDADESLRGNVAKVEDLLEATTVDPPTAAQQLCGEDTAGALPNNVYGWGRIDAFAAYEQAIASCLTPPVVLSLTIARTNASGVSLSWSAPIGAAKYRVSWSASPYFVPGAACDPVSCREVATPWLVRDQVLGDADFNYTYVVQSMSACGAVQVIPSSRAGEFEYGVTAGE